MINFSCAFETSNIKAYTHDVALKAGGLDIHSPGCDHDTVFECSVVAGGEVGVEIEAVVRGQSPPLVQLTMEVGGAGQSEPGLTHRTAGRVSSYKLGTHKYILTSQSLLYLPSNFSPSQIP